MQKQFSVLVCLAVVIASCHGSTVAGKFDWQSFKHLARNVAVKSYNTVKDEVKSWRPWSEWTECTRKCGRGVHSRIRYCETGRHVKCARGPPALIIIITGDGLEREGNDHHISKSALMHCGKGFR
ncbi:hypothetical protein EB796_008521 [Bugula neritina]|uniref:Uncharacterized protein n=1 Tax=Bugula neritina TaxID=10212 RepID=A0A7J7K5F0_BUGNE|nr:hypothetical protein EB796_008521 [Bugula neritina]